MLSVTASGPTFEAGIIPAASASISHYEKTCVNQQTGDILVAWVGDEHISWRKMHADGTVVTADTTVPNTGNIPFAAFDVTGLSDGSFVIVWENTNPSPLHIYAYRIGDSGPAQLDASLGTLQAASALAPSVAARSDGSYVVTWTDANLNARLGHYSADGSLIGSIVQVNGGVASYAIDVGVDVQDDNSVTVFFAHSMYWTTADGAFIRRFDSSLGATTGEIQLDVDLRAADKSAAQGGLGNSSSSSFDRAGNLVVAWLTNPQQPGNGLKAKQFAASGVALGPEIQVTSGSTITSPEVAADSIGNFVVIWVNDDGTPTVEGKAYEADALLDGSMPSITLDPNTIEPAVAIGSNAFFTVWASAVSQPSDTAQLHAQQFIVTSNRLGDLDDDGDVDAHDIDILWSVIRHWDWQITHPSDPNPYGYSDDPNSNDNEDLNGDGYLNEDDVDYMLAHCFYVGGVLTPMHYGDADLDGGVGGLDYSAWRNRLPSADPLIAYGWAHGDWDGDGGVGGLDYSLWRTQTTTYPGQVGPHA